KTSIDSNLDILKKEVLVLKNTLSNLLLGMKDKYGKAYETQQMITPQLKWLDQKTPQYLEIQQSFTNDELELKKISEFLQSNPDVEALSKEIMDFLAARQVELDQLKMKVQQEQKIEREEKEKQRSDCQQSKVLKLEEEIKKIHLYRIDQFRSNCDNVLIELKEVKSNNLEALVTRKETLEEMFRSHTENKQAIEQDIAEYKATILAKKHLPKADLSRLCNLLDTELKKGTDTNQQLIDKIIQLK